MGSSTTPPHNTPRDSWNIGLEKETLLILTTLSRLLMRAFNTEGGGGVSYLGEGRGLVGEPVIRTSMAGWGHQGLAALCVGRGFRV